MNILLCADACPQTTAFYYERAFRSLGHNVTTFGPIFKKHDLDSWIVSEKLNFFTHYGAKERYSTLSRFPQHRDHVIQASLEPVEVPNIDTDLIVWIDSGPHRLRLKGLEKSNVPSVAIVGDLRNQLESQIEHARQFSYVFVQFVPDAIPAFELSGIKNVSWLPPAADDVLHTHIGEVCPLYDVGFIGSTGPWHKRRVRILQQLQLKFDVFIGSAIHQEMALMYKRCKVVFNCSLDGDINQRVPEGMISGRILVTDKVSGLSNFGTDSAHYLHYRTDEDAINTVELAVNRWNSYPDIGQMGYSKVLSEHTYTRRAEQVLDLL